VSDLRDLAMKAVADADPDRPGGRRLQAVKILRDGDGKRRQLRDYIAAVDCYAMVARNVQHAVLWGLANLSLDGLTDAAYDADQARTTAAVRATVAEEIVNAIEANEPAGALDGTARIAREHGKES
jgi:hypothetical protein